MMKTKLILLAGLFATTSLAAETLTADTAVFAQSDPKSAIITRLASGATVTVVGDAPAGWKRVEVNGPFEAYVNNQDITKSLEVRPGANIYATPGKDAQILTVATEGDKTVVTALVPSSIDFCQVRVEKKLQGFIAVGATANQSSQQNPRLTTPAQPVAPATASTAIGRPVRLGANTADMPRLFAGKLVLARRVILNPNPPYDYQLIDATGRRFAYVDTQRLLLTDKIDTYLDREISITGTVRNTVDGQDLVIAAESMQLK